MLGRKVLERSFKGYRNVHRLQKGRHRAGDFVLTN